MEEARKRRREEPKLRSDGGICGEQRELSILEIGDAGLRAELGSQEILNEPAQRAQLTGLRKNRLQVAFGSEDPVEFGGLQRERIGRETCRLS